MNHWGPGPPRSFPPQRGSLGLAPPRVSPGPFLHRWVWPCALGASGRLAPGPASGNRQRCTPPPRWETPGLAPPPRCSLRPLDGHQPPGPDLGGMLQPGRVPGWNTGPAPPPRGMRPAQKHPPGALGAGTPRTPGVVTPPLSAEPACVPPCGKHFAQSSGLRGFGTRSGPTGGTRRGERGWAPPRAAGESPGERPSRRRSRTPHGAGPRARANQSKPRRPETGGHQPVSAEKGGPRSGRNPGRLRRP